MKLTDFGIAKAVDAAPVTQTGHGDGHRPVHRPRAGPRRRRRRRRAMCTRWESLATSAWPGKRPFTGEGALTVAMKHIKEPPPPLPDVGPGRDVASSSRPCWSRTPRGATAPGGELADAVAAVRRRRPPADPRRARTSAGSSPLRGGATRPARRSTRPAHGGPLSGPVAAVRAPSRSPISSPGLVAGAPGGLRRGRIVTPGAVRRRVRPGSGQPPARARDAAARRATRRRPSRCASRPRAVPAGASCSCCSCCSRWPRWR